MPVIPIYYGFSVNDTVAIDSRFVYADAGKRRGISLAQAYEGLITYQSDTDEVWVLTDRLNASAIDDSGWKKINAPEFKGDGTTTDVALDGKISTWAEGNNTTKIPASKIINNNDVVKYADQDALEAENTEITWHQGDIAIITDDDDATHDGVYYYISDDQDTPGDVTIAANFLKLNIAPTDLVLSDTVSQTDLEIDSTTGAPVTIPGATSARAGVMSSADFDKVAQGPITRASAGLVVQPKNIVIHAIGGVDKYYFNPNIQTLSDPVADADFTTASNGWEEIEISALPDQDNDPDNLDTTGQILASTGVEGSEEWINFLPAQDADTNNLYLQSTGTLGSEVWGDLDTFPKVNYVNDRSLDNSLPTINVPNDEIAYISASRWFLNVSGAQINNVVVGDDDNTLNTDFDAEDDDENPLWIRLGVGSGYPDQTAANADQVLTSNGSEGQESWRGVLANAIHDPSTFDEAQAIPSGDVVYVGPGQWYKNVSGEEAPGVDSTYTLYNDADQWQQLGSSAYYTIISATDQTVYPGGLVYVDADNAYQNISGTVILDVNDADDDGATDFAEVDTDSNPLWLQVNSNVDTVFTLPAQPDETIGSYLRADGTPNGQWARVFHDARTLLASTHNRTDPPPLTTFSVAPNEIVIFSDNLWYINAGTENRGGSYEFFWTVNPDDATDDTFDRQPATELTGLTKINEYDLPVATGTVLGGVLVETGSDIDIDAEGKLTLGNIDVNKLLASDGADGDILVLTDGDPDDEEIASTWEPGKLPVTSIADGSIQNQIIKWDNDATTWGLNEVFDVITLTATAVAIKPGEVANDGGEDYYYNISGSDTSAIATGHIFSNDADGTWIAMGGTGGGIDKWVNTQDLYSTESIVWIQNGDAYEIYIWTGFDGTGDTPPTPDNSSSGTISPLLDDATNLWVLMSGSGGGSGNGIVKYVSTDTYPAASVVWVDDADDKIYTWIGSEAATSAEVPGTHVSWVELSKGATADFTVKSLLVADDDIAVNENDVVYLSSTRWYQYTGEATIASLTLANIDTTIAANSALWTRFASPAALEVNVLTTDAVTIADGQIAYLSSVAWYQNISGVDQTDIDSDYTTWDAVDTEDNPIWLQLGDVGRILLRQNGGPVVNDGASTIDFVGGDAVIVRQGVDDDDNEIDGLQVVEVNAIPSTQREELRFHFTPESSYTNVYGVDGDNILRVGFPGDSNLEEDTTFRTTLTISDVETVFDATVTITDDDNPAAGDETIIAIGEAMVADTDWTWNGSIGVFDNTTLSAIPANATWDNYWRDQTDREIIFMTWQQQGLGQFTIDLEQDSNDILDADQRVWRIQLFDSDTDEGGSIVFRQGYTSNSQYFYGSLGTDTDDFVAFTEWFGTNYDPQFGADYSTAVSQVLFLNADDYTPPGLESIDATNMATIAFCLTGDPDGPTKLSEGMGVRDMTLETGGGNGDFRVHFTSHLSGVRYLTGSSSVTEPIGFGSDAKTFQYETSRFGTNWSTLGRRNSKFIDIDLASDAVISIDDWRIVNSPATNDSLGGGTYEKATPTPIKVQTQISITGQDGEVVDGWPKLYHTLDKVNDPNIDDVISDIVTDWQTEGYTIERIGSTNSINILRTLEGFEDSRGWSISIDNNPDDDTLPANLTGNIALDDDFMDEGPDPDNEGEYIDFDGKEIVFDGYDNYVRANPDNTLPFGADLTSIQIFGVNHRIANGYTQINDVAQQSTLRFDDNFSVTNDSTNEETDVALADTIVGERTIELEGYVHAADAIPADPDAIPPQEAVDAVTEVIGDQFIIDSTTDDGTETFTVATVDRHGVDLFEQEETSFGNTRVTFHEVGSLETNIGGHLSTVDLKLYSEAGGSDSSNLPRMNLEVNNLSSDSDWAGSGEITFDRRFPLTAAGAHTGIYAESMTDDDGTHSRLRFTNSLANSEDTALTMEHDRVISFHNFETQDGVKFTNLTGTGTRLAIATDGTVTKTSDFIGELTNNDLTLEDTITSGDTDLNHGSSIHFEGNSDIGTMETPDLVPYGSIHAHVSARSEFGGNGQLRFFTDNGGDETTRRFTITQDESYFGNRTAEIGSTAQARAAHKLNTDLFTLGDFHRISTFDLEDTIYKDNVSGDIAEKSVIYEVTAQASFMDDADTPVNAETVAPLSHTRMEYESDDTDAFGTYIVGPYKQPRDESIGERWDTLKVSPGKTEFFGDANNDTDGTVIATIENGVVAIETYAEVTSGSIGTSSTTTVGTDTTARTYITYTYVGTDYYRVFRHADDTDTTFEGDEQIWDSIDNDDHRVVAIKNY